MNARANLILVKGQNKTGEIESCTYNADTNKYRVVYAGGKSYDYNASSIEWLKNPTALNPALVHVSRNGKDFHGIEIVFVFHAETAEYWHICFANNMERTYDQSDLQVEVSCLDSKCAVNCLDYLKQLSAINDLKGDDGTVLLKKQYDKLDFLNENSAMALYLNPQKNKIKKHPKKGLIFPFGGNASQFRAVEAAMDNQLSVIQGPPGTGKTQTILNILANLLVDDKRVMVVSNNNSATENVLEKLSTPQYGLGFLVAALGNSENKKNFLTNQSGQYPDLSDWQMDFLERDNAHNDVQTLTEELSEIFERQERLAAARLELDALKTEINYFESYRKETNQDELPVRLNRPLTSDKLMKLLQECSVLLENENPITFWFKFKNIFQYGIMDWKFYKADMRRIVTCLQKLFYQTKQNELTEEISELEARLSVAQADEKMKRMTSLSLQYLRAKLYQKYGSRQTRVVFDSDALWKRAEEVAKEYPVVLSTTFSARSSLPGVEYDYLIMDEASQVDVATGALALSCAKNAVIVGDLKQLPNVVTPEMRAKSDAVFASYHLPEGYSFSQNSFLKSVCAIIPAVPQTLLREHYRCHPKIIGFCNKKFYNGELLIMTQDNAEPDTLALVETVEGDHRRERTNQRQIDAMQHDVLPLLENVPDKEIGVVAPYRAQVASIQNQFADREIEVHTVHKFQGREKDTIILETVDDTATDFSDDPYLLNVAISRAKKRLVVVASGNEQPADSNIADLISYIRYNNYQVIQSEVYSVFDLLYKQYTDARIAYLREHSRVSEYDSENIMYGVLCDLLEKQNTLSLDVICHQPLNMLIRDLHLLNDEEVEYVMQPATHLDFLIYNTISKVPVLAIEVDGFHFHKPGTKQYDRDRMKDHILELYGLRLLRLPTNGSGEIEKISDALQAYADGMVSHSC